MRKNFFVLSIIIIIAIIIRFVAISSNPPSLTWDEVAWGYNAYTLGLDGKDEFGRVLPHDYLESFGDFKPPVYAYLALIPVKLFGVTELATRFPSAFFGVLTVLITYFLVKRIFFTSPHKEWYARLSALFLAISPWHLMLSRAAFEANVAQFFIITGVYLFLVAVQSRPWLLSLSAVSFVISMYTFNTSRIVAPLLVFLLGIFFIKKLLLYKKQTIVAILVGVVLILPIVGFLLSPQAALRFKEVNIFTNSEVVEHANQEIANDNNAWWSKIIHNRRVGYAQSYLEHYFDNLSFNFLFVSGDGNVKFSIRDVGQLYLWEFPFFIIGILFLIKKKEGYWWLIPLWLLLAIIPAGTARETPHALRTETALPTFQILTAYGVSTALLFLTGIKTKFNFIKPAVIGIVVVALLLNVLYFFNSYIVHYPREYSKEWQYGYKDAISYIKAEQDKYDKVFFTSELGRPHEYLLFYLQYSPEKFRQTAVVERDPFGFVNVKSFDKYIFGIDDAKKDVQGKKNLYIDIPRKVPGNATVLEKFKLRNGDVSLEAYTL